MTAVTISRPSPRRKLFDITVVPGAPQTVIPGGLAFQIVAAATEGAGTYNIEHAYTLELDDYRPTKNNAAADNTGLSNGGTLDARTTPIASPGVQVLKFTAVTAPTRFIAYGV